MHTELEKQIEMVTISDLDRLQIKKDGDCFFVCFDDFINLMESPAYFYDADSWQAKQVAPWFDVTETIHLPLIELIRVIKHLKNQETDLKRRYTNRLRSIP